MYFIAMSEFSGVSGLFDPRGLTSALNSQCPTSLSDESRQSREMISRLEF